MRVRRFRVVLAKAAVRDLQRLERRLSIQICKDLESYLEINPTPIGKPRIKKLSGFRPPLYRLRSGGIRAYYRILEEEVIILAVRAKKDSEKFLKTIGEERRAFGKKGGWLSSAGKP